MSRIRVRGVVAVFLMGLVLTPLAAICLEAGQNRSASISGVVVDESNRPVPRATVAVRKPGMEMGLVGRVTADDRGGFTIRGLPSGEFEVLATKPGFVDARSFVRQPAPNVTLSEGSRATVTLRLQTGGVISGTVVDRDGVLAQGVVIALAGRLNRFGRLINPPSVIARTNSRGEYRLFGLPAASYIVTATPELSFQGPSSLATEASSRTSRSSIRTLWGRSPRHRSQSRPARSVPVLISS